MIVKIKSNGDFAEVAQRPSKKTYSPTQIRDYFINEPLTTPSLAAKAAMQRDSAKFKQITDLTAKLAAMK